MKNQDFLKFLKSFKSPSSVLGSLICSPKFSLVLKLFQVDTICTSLRHLAFLFFVNKISFLGENIWLIFICENSLSSTQLLTHQKIEIFSVEKYLNCCWCFWPIFIKGIFLNPVIVAINAQLVHAQYARWSARDMTATITGLNGTFK